MMDIHTYVQRIVDTCYKKKCPDLMIAQAMVIAEYPDERDADLDRQAKQVIVENGIASKPLIIDYAITEDGMTRKQIRKARADRQRAIDRYEEQQHHKEVISLLTDIKKELRGIRSPHEDEYWDTHWAGTKIPDSPYSNGGNC